MKTKSLREQLLLEFGETEWSDIKKYLREAREPYPIVMTWKCIAQGRAKDGRKCIYQQQIIGDPNVAAAFVSENFTYVRFKGSRDIIRFLNPLDMQESIREFDDLGLTDVEEGDQFTLESPTKARSVEYSRRRREGIREGTHVVKPRGPNVNKRRTQVHHFRPY